MQTAGKWSVALQYRIIRGVIYPEVDLDDLSDTIGTEGRAPSRAPLDDPEAFLSFARLAARGEPSKEKVLEWVHRYGLLRRLKPGSTSEVVLQEDAGGVKRNVLNQEPMSLEEFQKEARKAYILLRLYEKLRDSVRYPLLSRQVMREGPGSYRGSVVRASMLEFSSDEGALDPELSTKSGRWYLSSLANLIEREIGEVKLTFTLLDGFAVKCPDLRTALYFQFACLVAGKRQTGICEVCGDIFIKTRRDKKVCGSGCRSRKSRTK